MATPGQAPNDTNTVQSLMRVLRGRSYEEIRQRMYDNPPDTPWGTACRNELDLRNTERIATSLEEMSRVSAKIRNSTEHMEKLTETLVQVTGDLSDVVRGVKESSPPNGTCNLRHHRRYSGSPLLRLVPRLRQTITAPLASPNKNKYHRSKEGPSAARLFLCRFPRTRYSCRPGNQYERIQHVTLGLDPWSRSPPRAIRKNPQPRPARQLLVVNQKLNAVQFVDVDSGKVTATVKTKDIRGHEAVVSRRWTPGLHPDLR